MWYNPPRGGSDIFLYSPKKRTVTKSALVRRVSKKRKGVVTPFNAPSLSLRQKDQLEEYNRKKGK